MNFIDSVNSVKSVNWSINIILQADYEMVQFDDDNESFELSNDSSSDSEILQTEVTI